MTKSEHLSPGVKRAVEKAKKDIDKILDGVEPVPTAQLPAWQPIETAPKDGTTVLLVFPANGKEHLWPKYGIGSYTKFEDGAILWDWGWAMKPTHWMPLPEAPE